MEPNKQTENKRLETKRPLIGKIAVALVCSALLGSYASAQVQSQPQTPPPDQSTTTTTTTTSTTSTTEQATPSSTSQEQVVELTPFEVRPGDDNGYESSSTLSGTRLRTNLGDVASAITVVNKTTMDDLNAHDLQTLLNYTVGTEVAGMGGNFSDASISPSYYGLVDNTAAISAPEAQTRVRGLEAADFTRDFFLSAIPMDDFDIDRVEISRGANAMLFGLGSPAGIINASIITAHTDQNAYSLSEAYGSFGSNRTVLDANQVLFKDKLAIRVAIEDKITNWQQYPTFDSQQKLFVGMTYRPFQNTTIRMSTEWGQINSNLGQQSPPFDDYTQWWSLGKPTYNPITGNYTITGPASAPNAQVAPVGTTGGAYTVYPGQGNEYVFNGIGNLAQTGAWAVIYSNPNSSVPSIPGYPGVIGMRVGQGNGNGAPGNYLSALTYPNRILVAENSNTAPQDANYWFFPEINNPKIYNFFDYSLDGPTQYEYTDWNSFNATFSQTFLNNHAGIELAVNHEETNADVNQPNTFWGETLYIDYNTTLLNGAPNPNFGRAFNYGNDGGFFTTSVDTRNTERETAFYDLDLRNIGGPAWLGKILGHHVFTLTNSYFKHRTETTAGDTIADTNDYEQLVGNYTPPGGAQDYRLLGVFQYAGGNVSGASTPQPVPAITVGQWPTQYQTANVLYANTPTTANPNPTWSVIQTGIQSASRYSIGDNDLYPSSHLDVFSSTSFVTQDYWFGGDLVSTVGWRNDQYRSYDGGGGGYNVQSGFQIANPLNQPLAQTGVGGQGSKNYGLVGHVPDFIMHKLPLGMGLSLIYNKADNFEPTAQRFDVFGNPIPPVSGITKEYGARLTLFNNKIDFKWTHYSSSEAYNANGELDNAMTQTAIVLDETISDGGNSANPQGEVALLNFLNSPGGKNYTKVFGFQFGPPLPGQNGLPQVEFESGGSNIVGTQDVTSTGNEFELGLNPLPNWRIAINGSEAQAITDNSAIQLQQFVNSEIKPLINGPAGSLFVSGGGGGGSFYQALQGELVDEVQQVVLQDGTPTQELRRWHWNAYTNYNFTQEKLKGWGIGGAVRWEDRIAIGFPILNNPTLGPVPDIAHPFLGPPQQNFSAWLSYSHKLPYHIMWKAQFNLDNIGIGNKLIPINAQPNGQIAAWNIEEPQRWTFTNTFTF